MTSVPSAITESDGRVVHIDERSASVGRFFLLDPEFCVSVEICYEWKLKMRS